WLRDAGARSGVKLFAIAPDVEAAEDAARAAVAPDDSARLAAEAEAEASAIAMRPAQKKNRPLLAPISIASLVILAAGAGFFWMRGGRDEPVPVAVSRHAG